MTKALQFHACFSSRELAFEDDIGWHGKTGPLMPLMLSGSEGVPPAPFPFSKNRSSEAAPCPDQRIQTKLSHRTSKPNSLFSCVFNTEDLFPDLFESKPGHIWIHLGDVWCILLATRNHFHYGVRWCSRRQDHDDHETSREVAQRAMGNCGGRKLMDACSNTSYVDAGERWWKDIWMKFLVSWGCHQESKTFSKLGETWCSFVGLAQIQWIYPIGGVAPLWGWDKISHSHVPIQDELLHHFESFGSWSQPPVAVSWVSELNSESWCLSPHAITRFTLCNTF